MSFELVKHVALGGLEVHAGFVSAGNVSVPTAPLGAVPPAQLLEFDQPEVPTGAAPLQVKSVRARAGDGSPRTQTTTANATAGRLAFIIDILAPSPRD
jgi:hypothetical protein